jgi:uncharacterized protein
MMTFAVLGVLAGVLTTLSGNGGGLFLLAALTWNVGPYAALALSSPALLLANAHRAYVGRRDLDWASAKRLAAGALPGSVLGGLYAGRAPELLLRGLLLVMTGLAVAKALKWIHFTVAPRFLVPAGAGIGFLTGTSGGAGILLAPILLAHGLTGNVYIATQALVAFVMHSGRVASYLHAGLFDRVSAASLATIVVAILAGNLLAMRIRAKLSRRMMTALEYGALIACTLVSVLGVRSR